MLRQVKSSFLILSLSSALALIGACGGAQTESTLPEATAPAPAPAPAAPAPAPAPAPAAVVTAVDVPAPQGPIFFDFDSYTIKEGSKPTLQQLAEYMQKHGGAAVTIAGNTDERGTTEYNLALGDQRAKSAHDYLIRLGVDATRIKTISYGKERPAVDGHDESAWSRNRRDEFQTR